MEKLQEKIQNIDSSNINESDIAVIESTIQELDNGNIRVCLLYTSPSPRDGLLSRMPSSA